MPLHLATCPVDPIASEGEEQAEQFGGVDVETCAGSMPEHLDLVSVHAAGCAAGL